jgi:nitrite reductase (NADH) large subunit
MPASLPRPRPAEPAGAPAAGADPVVIVGAGPAGVRCAEELLRNDPARPIVLYGDEPWEPYQRVRLSSLLVGEIGWGSIDNRPTLPDDHRVVQRYHCAVVEIDRARKQVRDAGGGVQRYSRLILATGSRPYVPSIPGVDRPGVYTFRDLSDVQRLLARSVRTRRTVVLGGGLLGIEAARALTRHSTCVTLVQHATRLMNRQLDDDAAHRLRHHVEALGIRVILGDGVREIAGNPSVSAVKLLSGLGIECDTLVLATGIQPNIALAYAAGLSIGRGVRVDDRLRTSDPDIFAIGECAEHRGQVVGLVAPGLEQAAVVAHVLSGGDARYEGSVAATHLKVVNLPVFSVGATGDDENPVDHRMLVFADPRNGAYRKLILLQNRLVGAIAIGDCPEATALQEAVTRRRRVSPVARLRFLRQGRVWSEAGESGVAFWSAGATVCNCAGITRGTLGRAVADGCGDVESLCRRTGAGQVCGSCRPLLADLVGTAAQAEPQPGRAGVLGASLGAFLVLAMFLFAAEIPVADTVQGGWQPQVLWLDGFWKQVSGYALLGIVAIASTLSLRKRWKRLTLGAYPWWRLAHVALGTAAVGVLTVHTGLRLGNHLNFLLIAGFLALTALGSCAGAVTAIERSPTRASRRLRALSGYWHVVLLWPLPALLGFHVLSVYYF